MITSFIIHYKETLKKQARRQIWPQISACGHMTAPDYGIRTHTSSKPKSGMGSILLSLASWLKTGDVTLNPEPIGRMIKRRYYSYGCEIFSKAHHSYWVGQCAAGFC
jgi:hypothetical protein